METGALAGLARYAPSLAEVHIEVEPRGSQLRLEPVAVSRLAAAEALLAWVSASRPFAVLFYQRSAAVSDEEHAARSSGTSREAHADARVWTLLDEYRKAMPIVAVGPESSIEVELAAHLPSLQVNEAAVEALIGAAAALVIPCLRPNPWSHHVIAAVERLGRRASAVLVADGAVKKGGNIASTLGPRTFPGGAECDRVEAIARGALNLTLDEALRSGRAEYAAEIAESAASICSRNGLVKPAFALFQRVTALRFACGEYGAALAAIDEAVGLHDEPGEELATATSLYMAARIAQGLGLEAAVKELLSAAMAKYRQGGRPDLADGLCERAASNPALPAATEQPADSVVAPLTTVERLLLGHTRAAPPISADRPPELDPADMRAWTCVTHHLRAGTLEEAWCPRGQLPTRTTVLLARHIWAGGLGVPAARFVEGCAVLAAEPSLVRPAFEILLDQGKKAVGITAFVDDLLMGDNWRLQLVTEGEKGSVAVIAEVPGPVPENLDAWVILLTRLATARGYGLERPQAPTLHDVHALEAEVSLSLSPVHVERDLRALAVLIKAAESVDPSLDSTQYLMRLATLLAAVPGAPFLGLTDESLRLFRVILRRMGRGSPTLWAFCVRGALLALTRLTRRTDLPKLVATCALALEKAGPDGEERAILEHARAELFLCEQTRQGALEAVTACERSCEAAERAESAALLLAALECLARAYRTLGKPSEEANVLKRAAALPGADSLKIEERVKALVPSETGVALDRPWVKEVERWYREHSNQVVEQVDDRVVHATPFRPAEAMGNVVVLRPLVTALVRSLPNGFTRPLRHAWRFEIEPDTMTLEETLSRALGHRFSFTAIGAKYEAWGIGRVETLPRREDDPDGWKAWVELHLADPILCAAVLVYPSDSPGMEWELDLLARTKQRRPIFVIPPDVNPESARGEYVRGRGALLTRGLATPEWHPQGLVFRHDDHGRVVWSETFAMIWDGRLADVLVSEVSGTPGGGTID